MKKIVMIGIIGLVIVLLLLIVGFYIWNFGNENHPIHSCHYEVLINADKNAEYHLLVPLPDTSSNMTWNPQLYEKANSDLLDNLSVAMGNANFQINNTSYGKALEIYGKGNCTIIAESKSDYAPYLFMSMQNISDEEEPYRNVHDQEYWTFLEFINGPGTDISLEINCTYGPSGNLRISRIGGNITQVGWSIILGSEGRRTE